ncbi:MAG: phosphate uptake regulator PhoU [Euryarchaeota archaeon]|nr:phosphate uptake regulator PhoU [Euryarchaeota archaeon]
MEKRKAHRVGRSSTAVTLPFEWVVRNGINPGDELSIYESDQSTLILTTGGELKSSKSEKVFEIRSNTPSDHLKRLLIGTYLVGTDDVTFICTDDEFAAEQLEALNESVGRLTGYLVVEQTDVLFSVHNYLEPTGTLFSEHLRQLLSTSTRMVRMVPRLLSNPGGSEMCRVLSTLGDQSDMLYYLTVRILLMSLSNRRLMIDLGLDSPQEVVGGRLIAKSLEEICDRIECLARLVEGCEKNEWGVDETLEKSLSARISHICDLIEVSVEGFFTGSVSLPDSAMQELYELERSSEGPLLTFIASLEDAKVAATLSGARSLIQEIGRLTRVISEVAMNNSLRRC